jgi:hypothetical protein
MTIWKDVQAMWGALEGVLEPEDGAVRVRDGAKLRDQGADALVWNAVFAEDAIVRDTARWAIRAAARALGIESASIYPLYAARGRGEMRGFSVPAINIRGITYDTARAALGRRSAAAWAP